MQAELERRKGRETKERRNGETRNGARERSESKMEGGRSELNKDGVLQERERETKRVDEARGTNSNAVRRKEIFVVEPVNMQLEGKKSG